MLITHDDVTYEGVAVLPRKARYSIEVESRGQLDLFSLSTCHREWIKERAWNTTKIVKTLFGWSRKVYRNAVRFDYTPVAIEEKFEYCPMILGAYEQEKGRHSWGFVDFETPDEHLEATMSCNGMIEDVGGVSVCQGREGLIQNLMFEEDVSVESSPGCNKPEIAGGVAIYEVTAGQCVYLFMGARTKQLHRHTSIGYQDILIRGQ